MILRTQEGRLIGRLSPVAAQRFLEITDGHWRPYKAHPTKKVNAFEVDNDIEFGFEKSISIFLFKGDVLLPDGY